MIALMLVGIKSAPVSETVCISVLTGEENYISEVGDSNGDIVSVSEDIIDFMQRLGLRKFLLLNGLRKDLDNPRIVECKELDEVKVAKLMKILAASGLARFYPEIALRASI